MILLVTFDFIVRFISSPSTKIVVFIEELLVGNPGSIHIGLNGLGPLNWLGKKLVLRHIR